MLYNGFMYDLVSIGSVTIDLYFKGSSLTLLDNHFHLAAGGKYFADFFHEGLGGGAANVAIGAQRSGSKVALMAKIGNNAFKPLIMTKLQDLGITTEYCDIEDNYNNVSSILLTESGEKTVINYRTAHSHFFSDMHIEKLQGVKGVYFANMPDASVEERFIFMNSLAEKGSTLFVNLGVNDCRRPDVEIEKLLSKAHVVIVNEHEFGDLVKLPHESIDFKTIPAVSYLPLLRDKTVIVTMGATGSYGYRNQEIYFQEAIKPEKIIDTTGAGDGYTAGFIAEYLKTTDIPAAMKSGAAYSSQKLSHLGAN